MSESASRFHGKRLSGVPASDWPPITAEQWRAPVRFDVPPRRTLTGRVVRWAKFRPGYGGVQVTTSHSDGLGRFWDMRLVPWCDLVNMEGSAESRALAATR